MSGKRKEIIATGEIYHIFNRSVANEEIFSQLRCLRRSFELLKFYRQIQNIRYSHFARLTSEAKNQYLELNNGKQLVTIYSFSLMPTHFHLLLKQDTEGGIVKYLSDFQNSYAKYFNLLKSRHGSIFQQPFKAKRVETDGEFLHISRYIHLNPVTSYLIDVKELPTYEWSSFKYYVSRGNDSLVNTKLILKLAGSIGKYKKFVKDQVDYQRKLAKIRRLILE
jgi:putative transposase